MSSAGDEAALLPSTISTMGTMSTPGSRPGAADGRTKGASDREVVFNMINGVLGGAVLSLPFCCKQMGLLLSLVVIVTVALVNRTSQQLMLLSGHITGRMNYEGIASTLRASWFCPSVLRAHQMVL